MLFSKMTHFNNVLKNTTVLYIFILKCQLSMHDEQQYVFMLCNCIFNTHFIFYAWHSLLLYCNKCQLPFYYVNKPTCAGTVFVIKHYEFSCFCNVYVCNAKFFGSEKSRFFFLWGGGGFFFYLFWGLFF